MKKRFISLVLAAALAASMTAPAFAVSNFSDVPDTHWASSYINEMVGGGLIQGYGHGKFGPSDNVTIAQMAKIISSVKGYKGEAKNGYWAYGAIEYCINTLECLPDFGDITAENYDQLCTRELAFYMLEKGLGVGPKANLVLQPYLSEEEIPDLNEVDQEYYWFIFDAYRDGLCVGIDDKGTFNPKGLLTRAEAATMFVRAGWTKVTDIVELGDGLTNVELYNKIKAMGIWTESTDFDTQSPKLTATDPKYGGVEVILNQRTISSTNMIDITMREWNRSAWGNNPNGFKALDGSIVKDLYDSNGKLIVSSGFSYDARMLVKRILQMAYPNHPDEAINGFKAAFMQEIREFGNDPSAFRWIDHRAFHCGYDDLSYSFSLTIMDLNDQTSYDEVRANLHPSAKYKYSSYNGSFANDIKAWELTKW